MSDSLGSAEMLNANTRQISKLNKALPATSVASWKHAPSCICTTSAPQQYFPKPISFASTNLSNMCIFLESWARRIGSQRYAADDFPCRCGRSVPLATCSLQGELSCVSAQCSTLATAPLKQRESKCSVKGMWSENCPHIRMLSAVMCMCEELEILHHTK